MIKKLWCRWFGHRRGKRLLSIPANDVDGQRSGTHEVTQYVCMRCGHVWTRKTKAKPAPAHPAIPASIRKQS